MLERDVSSGIDMLPIAPVVCQRDAGEWDEIQISRNDDKSEKFLVLFAKKLLLTEPYTFPSFFASYLFDEIYFYLSFRKVCHTHVYAHTYTRTHTKRKREEERIFHFLYQERSRQEKILYNYFLL